MALLVEKAPGEVRNILKNTISKSARKLVTKRMVKDIPKKPLYPIHWASKAQRRKYYATRGFYRGIPTKRTGGITKWSVRTNYTKSKFGEITIDNKGSQNYYRYVIGDWQQRFHARTKWYNIDMRLNEISAEIETIAAEALIDFIDKGIVGLSNKSTSI